MNHIQSFVGSNFVQFCILSMLCICTDTPKVILSVNFGLFGENFATSFFQREIKRGMVEEVCQVGP